MEEKRRFHRIGLAAKCLLSRDDASYQGQLENISLNGALVRFAAGLVVPRSGEYVLAVFIEGEDLPLRLAVEVVCATNGLTGIEFVSSEAGTPARLVQLVQTFTSEPDKLRVEQERIRKHLAEYLRSH